MTNIGIALIILGIFIILQVATGYQDIISNDSNFDTNVTDKIANLEKAFSYLASRVQIVEMKNKVLEEKNRNLEKTIEENRSGSGRHMFSYYANSGSVSSGSYLTFNIPMVNNDGNFDGTKFKCPFERNVFYDFSFAGSGYSNEITVIAVKKNGIDQLKFFFRDSNVNDYHLISFSWKMELAFEDEVSLYVERGKIVSGSEANRIFNGIHIIQ